MGRKFRVVECGSFWVKMVYVGMVETQEELRQNWIHDLEGWDGSLEHLNNSLSKERQGSSYIVFEEVKEPTLIEKIADHFGVAIGEKFNLFWGGDQKILKDGSPYEFSNEFIYNSYDNWDFVAMNYIICGDLLIEKIPVKSAKDLAIEEAEKRLEEAQEALKKAKEME